MTNRTSNTRSPKRIARNVVGRIVPTSIFKRTGEKWDGIVASGTKTRVVHLALTRERLLAGLTDARRVERIVE